MNSGERELYREKRKVELIILQGTMDIACGHDDVGNTCGVSLPKVTLGVAFDNTTWLRISVPSFSTTPFAAKSEPTTTCSTSSQHAQSARWWSTDLKWTKIWQQLQNPKYLLGENVCTVRSSRAGNGLRHSTHSSLHITPCTFLLLQLPHHMVQEHIPTMQDRKVSVWVVPYWHANVQFCYFVRQTRDPPTARIIWAGHGSNHTISRQGGL